jgi:hypothetical protein
VRRFVYRVLTLGSRNISERALALDDRVGWLVTLIGIPSAFLLHGYVGFIFGSVKANPWWSTPLMPIVFLFSAIVSGIALVLLMYMAVCALKGVAVDMRCADTMGRYLLYAFIIDFSLEMLDLLHRVYEADESFKSLDFMVHTRLYASHILVQIVAGTILPIGLLALSRSSPSPSAPGAASTRRPPCLTLWHLRDEVERRHRRAALLQELPRLHDLQDGFATREGLFTAACSGPAFAILWGLVRLLPPWTAPNGDEPDRA